MFLGDGTVGKSALLLTYTQQQFPEAYTPTLVPGEIIAEGKNRLLLTDTPGQKEYKRLRMLSFKNTTVFVLLFAIDNKMSFDNVEDDWFKEIREHDPEGKIPFVLVGTKKDVRESAGEACISAKDGQALATKLGAVEYIELSAKSADRDGVSGLFTLVFNLATGNYKKKGKCTIL